MPSPLRLLILEDRPADAELMLYELRRAGLAVDGQRVETEADFVAALNPDLDLILADYSLPQFNALRALQLLHQRGLDTPFIIVTGSISEEIAVECIKQGAADYLLKDRMTRLGQAVTHALEQHRLQVENRLALEALRASEQKYRRLHESMIDGFIYVDMQGHILDSNPSFQQMLGYSAEELAHLTYRDLTPDKWHAAEQAIVDEQILLRGYSDIYEKEYRRKDGTIFPIEIHTFLIRNEAGENIGMWAIVREITERKRAEEAVVQERLLLRTVIDNLPDAVYAKDRQGRKILANRADLDNIGKPENAVLGKTDAEIFAPHIAARFEADDQNVLQTGQAVLNREELLINEQGRQIWQLTSKLPLKDAAGHIIGLVGIGRDITDRRQAEDALRESERREHERAAELQTIMDTVPAFIWIAHDQMCQVVTGNRAAYELVRMPPESNASRTTPEKQGLTHVRIYQNGVELPPQDLALQTSAATGVDIRDFEQQLVFDDGTSVHELGNVVALFDEQGRPRGAVAAFIDITARKQAEQAWQQAKDFAEKVIQTANVIFVQLDLAGRVVRLNAAAEEISGYSRAEVEGKGWFETLVPKDRYPHVWEVFRHLTTPDEYPEIFENPIITKSGEERQILWKNNILHEEGKIVGSISFGVDITERKQAEEQLRQAERFAHATIDALSANLCVLDENGVILTVNQAWHDFAQANPPVPSAHFLGDNYLQVCDAAEGRDAAEAAAFAAGLRTVMRGDVDQFTLEYPCDAPWEKRWFAGRITRFLGKGPLRIVIVHEDITERRQMEVRLRETVVTLQTLAEIDHEITSATDSQSILDLVCRRAAELAHAPKSAIVSRIAGNMIMTASYGLRDATRVNAEFTRAVQAGLMNLTVFTTRETLVLNEITGDVAFMSDTFNREEVRALVVVPLIVGEATIGALVVLAATPRQWHADDLQILRLLAGQTAIALEKLRLLKVNLGRAAQLAMLNEIGQAITSSLDLDLMLVTLLDKVRRAASAEASAVALVDKESGDLVFRQAMGGAAHVVLGLRLPSGEGIVGWVAQHRQSVLVVDAASDARLHPLENTGGFVTHNLVCVPLIVHDTVTGVIELVNSRHAGFGQDDVQLLESVAAQAAIVIENARLFETEHTSRERLETLYRIGQAINSTLDADTILGRLTEEAVQATQATHGSALVARPERGIFDRRSLRGYSAEQAEAARANVLPLDRGLNGRAYRLRQTVYINDVTTDPDYHPLIATTQSELAVPILRGGQVIGNLDLQSPIANAFDVIDLQFLQALTDQVAIALENARLFEETQRQMEELAIVSQVALVGAAGRPFDETVARATDALSRLWPEVSLGFLFVDESGQTLRRHPSYIKAIAEYDPQDGIDFDQGLTGWAARHQQPIRVGDVLSDPRYVERIANIRSKMAAPLLVGAQVIGVVEVETPEVDDFSGDDLRLLTTLAGQLAVIFEKARLDTALMKHAAQLEQRVQDRTAEISREQARTQAILDALGEGVVVTDVQKAIQYINPALERMTGYTLAEVQGKVDRPWRDNQTPDEIYQEMWSTVQAGRTWTSEVVNQRKTGERYYASLTYAPILSTDAPTPQIMGSVGIQRDISLRKQAEEEVQRALEKEKELNELKSNFVSLTSHEFRTPLTTILSSAEMLEHYGARWTEERKHEHLQRIQTSVKYMTGLLNDVLVVAKAEANRLEFAPVPLDLLKFCRDLVEEIQLTDKAKHTLIFSGTVDCAQVNMDEHLLRHILNNLLTNALKYSPPESGVQFDLTCQAGRAVFRIEDHGLGIPLEDQARLFETFHRASNVRNIAGTGLGLTIVKRSVDAHGGTIEIVSQVGAGTTVTVSLPIGLPDEGVNG
jgi:PAS domain S-box-containing protein